MIQVNVQGSAWSEIAQELRKMVDGTSLPNSTNPDQEPDELAEFKKLYQASSDELELAKRRCRMRMEQLEEKDLEISRLKKLLDEAPVKNEEPQNAEESEQMTTDEPAEPTEPEQPAIKKADLREFLAKAREKGVNIAEILQPFGGRFPDVKPEDYYALLQATEAALAELEAKK